MKEIGIKREDVHEREIWRKLIDGKADKADKADHEKAGEPGK